MNQSKSFTRFEDFTRLYPLSKTLRFELRPIGKTVQNLSDVIRKDTLIADNFGKAKQIIDSYHKSFIEKSLSSFSLKNSKDGEDLLAKYAYYYYGDGSKDPERDEILENVSKYLRCQIVDRLSSSDKFETIDKKELIQKDLPAFVKGPDYRPLPGSTQEEDIAVVASFKDFTTYFTEFLKNRKNIYSKEDISTSIGHRLISDNLPKFLDNIKAFAVIVESPIKDDVLSLISAFQNILPVPSIADVFCTGYFNFTLTQTGIDQYNSVVGGYTTEDTKIQGINELVNLYNQQQTNKKNRLPRLKFLYKQILSDRNQISYLPEQFSSTQQMLGAVKEYVDLFKDAVWGSSSSEGSLFSLLSGLKDYDDSTIYWAAGLSLTDLSQKVYKSWDYISDAVKKHIEEENPRGKKNEEKYKEEIDKKFKKHKSFSLYFLQSCLNLKSEVNEKPGQLLQDNHQNSSSSDERTLADYIIGQLTSDDGPFEIFKSKCSEASALIQETYPEDKNFTTDDEAMSLLKALLDSIKEIQFFVKPLLGTGNEANRNATFYYELGRLWETIDLCTPLYNKVRNYCSKKPYSTEKIKRLTCKLPWQGGQGGEEPNPTPSISGTLLNAPADRWQMMGAMSWERCIFTSNIQTRIWEPRLQTNKSRVFMVLHTQRCLQACWSVSNFAA